MLHVYPALDDIDREIVERHWNEYNLVSGPRCGDYVEFADGVVRRISHVWSKLAWGREAGVQTSDGGSYYLDKGCLSFSGSLFGMVRFDTLTDTGEKRGGDVWIFHHDWHSAHNGVHATIPFRVYRCTEAAPR